MKDLIIKAKLIFINNFPDLKITAKQFTAKGKRYTRKELPDFLKKSFKDMTDSNDWVLENLKDILANCEKISESIFKENDSVQQTFMHQYFNAGAYKNEVEAEAYEFGVPVSDVLQGDKYIINRETFTYIPIDFEAFKSLFPSKEFKERFPIIPTFKIVYEVNGASKKGEIVFPSKGPMQIPQANLYIPPRWRFVADKHEDLHEDHKKMIWTRFANEESIERYFCVLFHMLTDRNKNICGLVHHREGTGKSTVMGKVPGHLVGMENTSYTDHNFMASPHKDAMLNKRMVFLDEHRLTKGQSSIEKKFVEDMLYINPKGKAAMTIYNTISWFMTSNNEGDIYTEPSNRRHYFLDDSGKHIVEEFGHEWVKSYNQRLQDPEFVANLGYYVLNTFKTPKYMPDAVYRGPSFERIVRATCHPGYEPVIEEFLNDEVDEDGVFYSEIKKDFNKQNRLGNKGNYFPRPQSFIDFFKDFRWEGKPICRVEYDSEGDINLLPVR